MSAELCSIKGVKVCSVRSMSNEEHARAQKAAAAVNKFSDNQHYFLMVERAYEEYNEAVGRYAEEFAVSGRLTFSEVLKMKADANRLLLNFLVIVVTFVEHCKAEAKRESSEDLEQLKIFEKATNVAYDEVFAYRFLWKMRNYFSHVTLPLKPDIHVRDADVTEPNPRLSFYFDRDELLRAKKVWPGYMKKEMKNLPEKIYPAPLLADMMGCLEELNLGMIYNTYGKEMAEGALYLRDLWPSREVADGHPCILDSSDPGRVMFLPIGVAHMISDTLVERQD